LAIIALVGAVAGLFVPVLLTVPALILAIVSARAIRRSAGAIGGSGLAYTAAITAALVLVVNVFTVMAIVRAWPDISRNLGKAGDVVGVARGMAEGRIVELRALDEGECFRLPLAGQVDVVEPVDCGTRHDGEIAAIVTLERNAYPGHLALEQEGREACGERFADYAAHDQDGDLAQRVIVPDRLDWENGDTTAVCALFAPGAVNGS
jgi:hypothetical protein